MGNVGVVTDSAGDLSLGQLMEHDIRVVPLKVRFSDKEYVDVVELDASSFWELMKHSSDLPQTSAPSIGEFEAAFREMAEGGKESIICITLSQDLSATYQSAVAAAKNVASLIEVDVIDSRFVSLAEGYLALKAAELAANNRSLPEIHSHIMELIPNISVFGTLDTLENLKKGGRIGAAQALLGSLLSFKPVIEVKDGAVLPESRQRTRSKALDYLLSKISESESYSWIGVMQAEAPETESFVEKVRQRTKMSDVFVTTIGPIIGTHAGIRTLGLTLVRNIH
ncbi:EDD domain protein, DegV family [Ferrithrix thermotolerans DSM 19514]|uniref:EDD domain protein, DegV family n=1 Tax=Ferrithrix thermotolerans DSM 19514 TaxID=1121881 RepID=A0A1M4X012_9ACTN|nr:EDD domain protein, DegV family [Ferrithrix thermotolerans DSM 19514]